MGWVQSITPNPDIACTPGWCLQYVRQAFGLPARYGSATEAWENSPSQHLGRDVPAGLWVPVWYAVNGVPEGHVALVAPDGAVYSTTDNTATPHHHPDLADLEAYYAYYGPALTWRGWTEDVAGYPVITNESETDMTPDETATLNRIHDRVFGRDVQRWFNPDTLEVRYEPFEGGIPARSSDIHDVMSTNNFVAAQAERILSAVAAIPGVDAAAIAGLREQLAAELEAATANLRVVLEVKP